MQYVGFSRTMQTIDNILNNSGPYSFISFWWYTWRHLYLDLLFSKPIWFHEFAVLIAHWLSLYLYKESRCTFSLFIYLCGDILNNSGKDSFISFWWYTWRHLYLDLLFIFSPAHNFFLQSEAEKMSTNRFCLLISRLSSCSVRGVALKMPLKQSLSFKFARFSFTHLVQGPDTLGAIRQRDAII